MNIKLRYLFVLLLCLAVNASAQTNISREIPVVGLSFFKGPVPENSSYASMTYIDYDYQFVIESSRGIQQL